MVEKDVPDKNGKLEIFKLKSLTWNSKKRSWKNLAEVETWLPKIDSFDWTQKEWMIFELILAISPIEMEHFYCLEVILLYFTSKQRKYCVLSL